MEDKVLLEYIYDNYDVQNWEILGVPVWPMIRSNLFGDLIVEKLKQESGRGKKRFNRIINVLKLVSSIFFAWLIKILDYKHNNREDNEQVVIVGYYHYRNFKMLDGTYFNVHIDPVIALLRKIGLSTKVFENVIPELFLRNTNKFPRYSNSCICIGNFFIIKVSCFINRIFNPYWKKKNTFYEKYIKFTNDMLERGIPADSLRDYRGLCNTVQEIISVKKFYKKHINRNTCKLGICVVDGLSPWNQAFFLACRDMGIKTVEIQHGVLTDRHVVYGNVKTNGLGYCNFPDYYFCWNHSSADVINKWAANTQYHHAFVVGNLLHKVWKNNLDDNIMLYKKYIRDKLKNLGGGKEKIVLVSLQGDNVRFPQYLVEVFSITPNVLWILRLHPSSSIDELKRLKNITATMSNVYLDDGSYIPLLAWLNVINLNVTVFSTVAIEASWYGVPTISVDQSDMVEKSFTDSFKKRYIKIAHTKEEFIEYLCTTNKLSEHEISNNDYNKVDFCEIVSTIINSTIISTRSH